MGTRLSCLGPRGRSWVIGAFTNAEPICYSKHTPNSRMHFFLSPFLSLFIGRPPPGEDALSGSTAGLSSVLLQSPFSKMGERIRLGASKYR